MFHESVDEYIEACRYFGKEPDKSVTDMHTDALKCA